MTNLSETRRGRAVRIAALAVVLGAAVLLTGCLDVVQYISGTSNEIDVYFRFTLQKGIFELAGQMGGEPANTDEMYEEFDLNEEEVTAELPPGVDASFRSINNESEFGFELEYTAARSAIDALDEGEADFVPRITPQGISIPLGEGNEGESDEFADAFLGSAKYRIMISKMLVSRISRARIVAGDEARPIVVTELPDIWLLEFPVSYWFNSAELPVVEVLF